MSRIERAAPIKTGKRRQKTRNAIIQAGHRLFAATPMEAVTIDDIVASADIAKGSFYNYFDDKEGLARTIYALVQADCEAHVAEANRSVRDPAERVMRALCIMLRYAMDHRDRMQAMLGLADRKTVADTPLNKGVTRDLRSGIKERRFVGVDVESGIVMVAGLITTTVRHALISGTRMPMAQLVTTVGAGMLRALGVDGNDAQSLAARACTEFFSKSKPVATGPRVVAAPVNHNR
jgi:AcrR family transcriptional regulator